MAQYIDLRSDTVTRPSEAMRRAMYEAEVGDDVFSEDPTVQLLQEFAADLLGKEAALYVPSGVMGNQICLNVLTSPGEEVICERDAHIFNYESGSPGALSGIQLNPISGIRGAMAANDVEAAIRPVTAYYMPRTRVVEIENTHNRASGAVIPLSTFQALRSVCDTHKLFLHLDGARIWNAAAASGISVAAYAAFADTVSCCLSKGLGAPVGSIIAGTKEFIKEAFRVRKGWGGGMRQAGIIAAAGLYALQHNRNRLTEDHRRAKQFAEGIAATAAYALDPAAIETNIILFQPLRLTVEQVIARAKERGVLLSVGTRTAVRAVTHLDISDDGISRAVAVLRAIGEEA